MISCCVQKQDSFTVLDKNDTKDYTHPVLCFYFCGSLKVFIFDAFKRLRIEHILYQGVQQYNNATLWHLYSGNHEIITGF